MGDIFHEQLVKRSNSGKPRLKAVGIVLLAVALIILVMSIPALAVFLPVFIIGIGLLAYLGLMNTLNIEYEYIFTNGELDIDVIYNRARRKRVFNGMIRDFELLAPAVNERWDKPNMPSQVRDYSSGKTAVAYRFIANVSGKRVQVLFEPNESMIKAFGAFIPSGKFIRH